MARTIAVTVKPNSRKPAVTEISPGEYHIAVRAAPVEGQANREVVDALAAYFKIPRTAIRILRGESARKKLIRLD